jgi:hypothetical protein
MGYFKGELKLRFWDGPLKDRPFELLEPISYYYYEDDLMVTVPAGYRTDFASIPRIFWRILSPIGKHGRAAVIHDYLCDVEPKLVDFKTASNVFNRAMYDLGVPPIKRHVMTWAVRLFGPKF